MSSSKIYEFCFSRSLQFSLAKSSSNLFNFLGLLLTHQPRGKNGQRNGRKTLKTNSMQKTVTNCQYNQNKFLSPFWSLSIACRKRETVPFTKKSNICVCSDDRAATEFLMIFPLANLNRLLVKYFSKPMSSIEFTFLLYVSRPHTGIID